VSEAAALDMARGARRVLGADVGLALTGVAGPAEQDGQPVGTLCVGVVLPDGRTASRNLRFGPGRETMRQLSVITALDALRRALLADERTSGRAD
jgi:PncC family amidohydrolase